MTNLPESARLALWLNAWVAGRVSPDDLRDAVVGDDAAHDVLIDGETAPLLLALGTLRSRGAIGASLALPVPGDLLGLAGPAAANDAALEAGQAVLVRGAGLSLVPVRAGAGVVWVGHDAVDLVALPDLFEAGTALRQTVAGAAESLAALDVARWRPEIADELMALRRPVALSLPASTADRIVAVLGLATRCLHIADLALAQDAGVTSFEIDRRRDALGDLRRASRRALVAACSG